MVLRQMGIGRQVEPGRPSLDPRQRDQLDRIEADSAEPDRLGHGEGHDLKRYRLQQPQHLDELALAAVAHAGFQQMAQVLEGLGQIPALQRRRLIERVGLGLDQREIMQRVGHEHAFAVAARVPGDLASAAQDHDLVDKALHHDVLEAVAGRHRVVVGAVADQCGRRDPRRTLLARFQRHGQTGAVAHGPRS